jgi:membrane fusion protein, multidrug efflux system
LPETAVDYTLYGDSVYVVKETKSDDGKSKLIVDRTFVKTGTRIDGRTVILSGVNEGDRIVAVGQLKLQPGATVVISDDPLPVPPANPPRN